MATRVAMPMDQFQEGMGMMRISPRHFHREISAQEMQQPEVEKAYFVDNREFKATPAKWVLNVVTL